jgi:TatD DNase family protein
LADARKNLALSATYPMIKVAAGLYPTHLEMERAREMADFIRDHRQELVAIGEVGLDYWAVKDPAKKTLQRDIFRMFIALSNELALPLNIHSRSAGRYAIDMLIEHGAFHAQLHAFDGKYGAAIPAVEAGYFFSIPPSVVRSRQKQKLVKQLPLSCLLVESDSPVLGPVPGERNEPANISVVIDAISRIKGIDPGEVAEAVTENAARLYRDLS